MAEAETVRKEGMVEGRGIAARKSRKNNGRKSPDLVWAVPALAAVNPGRPFLVPGSVSSMVKLRV